MSRDFTKIIMDKKKPVRYGVKPHRLKRRIHGVF